MAARKSTNGNFKKGFDPRRNLKGRAKVGLTLAEKIRDALNEKANGDYSKLDALIDTAWEQAISGNFQMLNWLSDHGYGRVPEKLEVTKEEKLDLSKLSNEELAVFKKLMEKASEDS